MYAYTYTLIPFFSLTQQVLSEVGPPLEHFQSHYCQGENSEKAVLLVFLAAAILAVFTLVHPLGLLDASLTVVAFPPPFVGTFCFSGDEVEVVVNSN